MRTQIFDPQYLEFGQTDFNLLMQRRIYRVLIVCSNYDYFTLEEDGRIDEQIFNEYTALSIRFPPVFIQANSAKRAFEILQSDEINLVILMLNIGDTEPFELAHQVRQLHPDIPIVVLTHFSREVSIRLQFEDLSAIDHVFCWLGNADLLLAIIKLIEDLMNAENDVLQVGVQTILLVEDSVRFISQILPNLYKIIIRQSHLFAQEGLNEHQRMLRLRGRPKILLAKTFDEAQGLYLKYGEHMLGIISDISYKKNRKRTGETLEGLELCRLVRSDDPYMPFLLQSSDSSNEQKAHELNAGFVNKLSKSLSHDLQNYIVENFGFGELVFRNPDTREPVLKAADLAGLQQIIQQIPDSVFRYHASRNDISKWLNARALFTLGSIFKLLQVNDFDKLDHVRTYIYEAISNFRLNKGRGIIATFDSRNFDEYVNFSRIGDGSLGGKGRGLAFVDSMIKKHKLTNLYPGILVAIPRTVVISTDLFDEFMETNDLYRIGLSDLPNDKILEHFVSVPLPQRLHESLKSFVEISSKPIAVRSSSKLEDSHYQPFAGVYSTYMLPLVAENSELSVQMLAEAIKCVYASVYFTESKAYITATSNVIDEEKMGIILQEVCGQAYENRYYPALSGVARSVNFYPVKPEMSSDGIANIALGLGKYVVEGGNGLRFSPKFPKKIWQLSNTELTLRETQKYFYALNLNSGDWHPSVDDKVNLLKIKVSSNVNDAALRFAASYYDHESQIIVEGNYIAGKPVITFSPVLNHGAFPLAPILQKILEVAQQEMNVPIEIEFAVDLDVPSGEIPAFYLLQIRPIVESDNQEHVNIEDYNYADAIVYSHQALGNGVFKDICDFVYIKPESFNATFTQEMALEIEKINTMFRIEKRNYVLAGPGRWGSSDPWLGIPVKWPQISEARIIIESSLENYRIDPSQGTHFFQNLTSFRVGYMTVNQYIKEGFFDYNYLSRQMCIYESAFLRVVRFASPLNVKIDGRNNLGVILK